MVENLELRFLFLFHVLVFLVKSKKKLSDVEITGLKIFDKALIGSNETGDSFEDIYISLTVNECAKRIMFYFRKYQKNL